MMLRDLEKDEFLPALESLTGTMLAAARDQYQAVRGTTLEEPARRNLAYFAVAAQLLGLPEPVPPEVIDLVAAETALIDAHGGPVVSPIWDRPDLPDDKKLIEDYSQYVPRGHYTRSEELKRYFRAMMWYGRMTFRLRDDFETRRALLMVEAMRAATAPDGTPATQLWASVYEPTTFIVGKSDDLSYQEYGVLATTIFPTGDLQALADDSLLAKFNEAARQLPAPQVNSMWVWIWEDRQEATQGFRFMGQRYTLDEYVFGQLIWRKVGTQAQPRGLPLGLDFFAAMGSDEALNILEGQGETQYANYPEQMTKVRGEVASLGLDSWGQSLYWSWLYAFQPIIAPKDARFPAFMRTQAWTRKDLNTALGSWTELKHDTLLYAKQVMAELGGGGRQEPPRGYVEPNPEAFARMHALAQMMYVGLDTRGMLSDTTRGNLDNLVDLLGFLKSAAERELNGEILSDDDYWRIRYIGGELEFLTIAASDCEGVAPDCRDLSDQKAALVADVATGFTPDGSLAALAEAVGQPTEIYVVLPDAPLRVAVGAVFSYYEFTVPPSVRVRVRVRVRVADRSLGSRLWLSLSLLALCLSAGWQAVPGTVTLALLGDVMLGRGVALAHAEGDWETALADLAPQLNEADLALANLESPLTTAPIQREAYDLRADPSAIAALTSAGLDLLSIVNNHTLDSGAAGLTDTREALLAAGLTPIESGPHWRTVNGVRLAFVAFEDVTAPLDLVATCETIAEARNSGGVVVVSLFDQPSPPAVRRGLMLLVTLDESGVRSAVEAPIEIDVRRGRAHVTDSEAASAAK